MINNRLVSGYNDAEIIHSSIRQPWKQTTSYEVVLSDKNLMVGAIGYHSANSSSKPLDNRPNIEWASRDPKVRKPLCELNDELVLKYVLYRLEKHDLPF